MPYFLSNIIICPLVVSYHLPYVFATFMSFALRYVCCDNANNVAPLRPSGPPPSSGGGALRVRAGGALRVRALRVRARAGLPLAQEAARSGGGALRVTLKRATAHCEICTHESRHPHSGSFGWLRAISAPTCIYAAQHLGVMKAARQSPSVRPDAPDPST